MDTSTIDLRSSTHRREKAETSHRQRHPTSSTRAHVHAQQMQITATHGDPKRALVNPRCACSIDRSSSETDYLEQAVGLRTGHWKQVSERPAEPQSCDEPPWFWESSLSTLRHSTSPNLSPRPPPGLPQFQSFSQPHPKQRWSHRTVRTTPPWCFV